MATALFSDLNEEMMFEETTTPSAEDLRKVTFGLLTGKTSAAQL